MTLRWTAATGQRRVRAYDIYRDDAKVGTITGTATTPPATTFIDSALAANTAYAYQVVARDAQANVSPRSNTADRHHRRRLRQLRLRASPRSPPTPTSRGGWSRCRTARSSTAAATRTTSSHLNPATGAKTSIGTVPNVPSTDGEGGLLGLAISASFATDHWLYIMHTSPTDNRIVRIKSRRRAEHRQRAGPARRGILRNKFHDGGRLRFGPDGKLYAATGDAQNGDNAQNLNSLNGKVLRLNPDGTVPSDNPFGNYVWSYGHRNPQGLAFDSQGRLWEQEFGNSVMDETNLITKGGNYGWPACEGTVGTCGTAGFIAPEADLPGRRGLLLRHRHRPGRALHRLRARQPACTAR